MQKVRFINSKGESVYFDVRPPFILQRIEGTGEVGANTSFQRSPQQDGGTYINSKLDIRDIFMQISLIAPNQQELFKMRQDIQRVFNPRLGQGYLIYETPNGSKMLICAPDSTPIFSNYINNSVTCIINMTAFNPLWTDVSPLTESTSISNYINRYETLPTIPHFEAIISSVGTPVINNGTFNTPMIIEIYGETSSIITIKNNTTGTSMKINRMIPAGSKLHINTVYGSGRIAKLISSNGIESNGFPYISFDSDYIQLEVGTNNISYESLEDVYIKVRWHNNYIGL